jgi:hypothetical protein
MAFEHQARFNKALAASRETKDVEFKSELDPDAPGTWCEVIKDIVAIANSGGGAIIVGVDDNGVPTGFDATRLDAIDPAFITDRLARYIGQADLDFSLWNPSKGGCRLWAMTIGRNTIPCIFEKPGTYADGARQKSAFSQGTLYFRRGAKSETGNNRDITRSLERHIEETRKRWLAGVRKVVEAPAGSSIVVAHASGVLSNVRSTSELGAVPVRLTRNSDEAQGTFLHEQVSEELFAEINNVIEANRILFPDRNRFLLGQSAYYRIYSERLRIDVVTQEIEKLFATAVTEYYPCLTWFLRLDANAAVPYLVDIYKWPKGNEVSLLLKMAALFGIEFREWLATRFTARWGRYSQPPGWYHRCVDLSLASPDVNRLFLATKLGPLSEIDAGNLQTVTAQAVASDPQLASNLLTATCMRIFAGEYSLRSQARNLDVLSNGPDIIERAQDYTRIFYDLVGDSLPSNQADS